MKEKANCPVRGAGVFEWFRFEVDRHWSINKPRVPPEKYQHLKKIITSIHQRMSVDEISLILIMVINAYKCYQGDSLEEIYQLVKEKLDDWSEQERSEIAGALSSLGQQFGTISLIRATELGNVIESYSVYPYKCYGMEHAEVLWPRLQYVLKPEFLAIIQEPRILLDFCLTNATLSSFFGLFSLIGGPWLWLNYWFWGTLALTDFVISYFFYRAGVFIALPVGGTNTCRV